MSGIRNPYGSFSRYSADLCLFLLVAKTGQLSAAATEAGLSQPRISQRMRALEDSLGQTLFLRERRGVTLTPDGMDLLAALQRPLGDAIEAFDAFRRKPQSDEVVIMTDIAFSTFLLLPEIASLSAAFPNISISVLSQQKPDADVAPKASLTILMEPVPDGDDNATLLFKERVTAVCSPAYKARHPEMREAKDLADKTLIDLAAKADAPWYTWAGWLKEQGGTRDTAREFIAFNSYDHVIRSARSGLGIALGWEGLVNSDDPGSGLIRAIPAVLESNRGYVLRAVDGRAGANTVKVFDWLADTFATT